jgi:WD40 repeat protein/tRNA A-37 threonylcarbamoyl transferase component Bud32
MSTPEPSRASLPAPLSDDANPRGQLTADPYATDPNATRSFKPSASDPSAPPPDAVPGYVLLESIGAGGMGVVYKARQGTLNRIVALKMVLGGHRAGAKELIRFLAEAEAVAAVKHPHVVQVHEYGEADGRPFLAMEFLSGGSLSDRLKAHGRLDPIAAARLVATLAGAVQAAHDQGIVHRDLKPGNVLFDEAGEPKVTDFGLAKRGGSDLTASQAVMGTPAYMAPEQARGDTKFVGPGADVYALGVILYECLTGTRPFAGSDAFSLLRKVTDEEPERPSKRIAKLPRDVELICLKCLAKEPAERYPTATALAADLERFASGEPVSVRAAGWVERGYKWARRKPTLAAAYGLTLAVLVLLGFGISLATLWRSAEGARASAEFEKGRAETERKAAETARDGEKVARAEAERGREKFERFEYGRSMQVAYQEWRENKVGATLALLDRSRPDFRGWEWRYLHRLCHSNLLTHQGVIRSFPCVPFSPDGSRIVTSWGQWANVWDARTGEELLTLKGHAGDVYLASFSPDGSRIVTRSKDKTAKLWDARTGANLLTIANLLPLGLKTLELLPAAFSPDGLRLVTGNGDQTARVWDAKSGGELLVLKGHTSDIRSVVFSPDGSRIVTGSGDKTVRVWDARTGAEVSTLKGINCGVYTASFSPDGSRIVATTELAVAKVWDAKTGAELLLIQHPSHGVRTVSYSPDGLRLVSGGYDQSAKVWDARTGAELLTLRGHTGPVQAAAFSPDGSRIVTASEDGTCRIWDPSSGSEARNLGVPGDMAYRASFSPDGLWLLTVDGDQTKVWDARSATGVRSFRAGPGRLLCASFSPDSSRIVSGRKDGTVKVWNARTGAEVHTLVHTIKGLAKSDEERNLLQILPKSYNGESAEDFLDFSKAVWSAGFSPDGSRIVTGSGDRTAKVWDARSGAELLILKGHTGAIKAVEFSPDGSRIVTGSEDNTGRVWDARTGDLLLTLKGHGSTVYSASFSPDGSRILTSGLSDHTAKVWDARTGAEILTLKGHHGDVYSAAFSPDGSRIVTGSHDNTAKIWDTRTGADLLTLKGHSSYVHSVAFSPDGAQVVTVAGVVRFWDATPVNRAFLPQATSPPPTAK